jgi:hypothetical protein
MPLYLFSHAIDLSPEQQDKLAVSITKIHTELFTAPSLFVNVRFSPASQYTGYVGGKRSQVNTIQGHVRHGPSRTPAMYEKLTGSIAKLWREVVRRSFPHDQYHQARNIFVEFQTRLVGVDLLVV